MSLFSPVSYFIFLWFGINNSVSLFFLILCVRLCAFDKTATSACPDRMVLCRGQTSSVQPELLLVSHTVAVPRQPCVFLGAPRIQNEGPKGGASQSAPRSGSLEAYVNSSLQGQMGRWVFPSEPLVLSQLRTVSVCAVVLWDSRAQALLATRAKCRSGVASGPPPPMLGHLPASWVPGEDQGEPLNVW